MIKCFTANSLAFLTIVFFNAGQIRTETDAKGIQDVNRDEMLHEKVF